MRRLLLLLTCLALAPAAHAANIETATVPLSEQERSFLEDGPGYLLSEAWRSDFREAGHAARGEMLQAFLSQDPVPATAMNELREGIARRRRLLRVEGLSPRDVRGQLLFLHGRPVERHPIDCGAVYKPLEIWIWTASSEPRSVLLFRPARGLPYELWTPRQTKAAIYTEEMAYYLRQWEDLSGWALSGRRFDHQLCDQAEFVDRVTGISGLHEPLEKAPSASQLLAWLDPPQDLAEWAREAAATELPASPPELPIKDVEILFPRRHGQRIVARIQITLPSDAPLEPWVENEKEPELRLAGEVRLEQGDEYFEQYRVRFHLSPPPPGEPIPLVLERALRPDRTFVLRLHLMDEIGKAETWLVRSFTVPERVERPDPAQVLEGARASVTGEAPGDYGTHPGSLRIVPAPPNEVQLGHWRAEVIVAGDRIAEVAFFVDGERRLTRTRPPFTADLRLSELPQLQTVRAEGYDEAGKLIAADEVVLNQPQGAFRVEITRPARGDAPRLEDGQLDVAARVVAPRNQAVRSVEFRVNDVVISTLEDPPWEAKVPVPEPDRLTVLSVVAYLEDGSRQEDVRILNAARFGTQVEVELVELYATVTDGAGGFLHGLPKAAFTVFEEGQRQEIVRFREVDELPLHLGVVLDTSGSMAEGLGTAERAATGFLQSIMTPRDSAFALTFADTVELVMPSTDDPVALTKALTDLRPGGWTHLYDAIVAGVYHLREVRGHRALVVLTDGEDTASQFEYEPMLTYARRSGVVVYTIGIASATQGVDRGKLERLAAETGGRSFVISSAEELSGVYEQIEDELRSRYLLAYAPKNAEASGYREVRVEVEGWGNSVRTARGVYR